MIFGIMPLQRKISAITLSMLLTCLLLSCLDGKSREPSAGDSDVHAQLSSTANVVKRGAPSVALGGRLVSRVQGSPCAASGNPIQKLKALRRVLLEEISSTPDISYQTVYLALYRLTSQSSRACNGESCARPFGIAHYQVGQFLADSRRTAALLGGQPEGTQQRVLATLTPPSNGGVWNRDAIDGVLPLREEPLTLYTYVNSRAFARESKIVDPFTGRPNLDDSEEMVRLAEDVLWQRMLRGAGGTSGDSAFGNGFLLGKGLYAATDPYQSENYGNYLITYQVPGNAPYLLETVLDKEKRKNIVGSNAFGIIYRWDQKGVSGNHAIVLRYHEDVHTEGYPIIPGSIHVYDNGTKSGGLWDSRTRVARQGGQNPATVFLDEHLHQMHFFRARNYRLKDGRLTEKEIGGALAAELLGKPGPIWAQIGVNRFLDETRKKINREDVVKGFINRIGLDGGGLCLKSFFCRYDGSLADDTLLAVEMNLVSPSYEPKNYQDLKQKILDTWATPARRETLKNGIERYQAALQYWRKYNLDAFARDAH